MKKILLLLVAAMLFTTASCGTLLKNGKGGRTNKLDVTVVALDAVGLVFFLVPGIVAFAVDFSNKTIYK